LLLGAYAVVAVVIIMLLGPRLAEEIFPSSASTRREIGKTGSFEILPMAAALLCPIRAAIVLRPRGLLIPTGLGRVAPTRRYPAVRIELRGEQGPWPFDTNAPRVRAANRHVFAFRHLKSRAGSRSAEAMPLRKGAPTKSKATGG